MKFFSMAKQQVFKKVQSTEKGLDSAEAESRLKKYGHNELREEKKNEVLRIIIEQFTSFIVYILIVAFVISLILGEYLDATVIGAIIILNGILGFVQEYKAEKAIDALKKLSTPSCLVIRDGQKKKINARLVVAGDIVLLEAGATVPADCYILSTVSLQVDESSLTGESTPVNKKAGVLSENTALSERKNMIYSSTIAVAGKAMALVVQTGMDTEIGRIAGIIQQEVDKKTPLQQKLAKFGEKLGIIVILLCLIIFLAGYVSGYDWLEMFLIAVSLAVAAIPEGLPAVVTICLAVGVQRMIRRNVLIRKLSAVETLGSTTVICSDKTGTLTRNQMTVQKIYALDREIDVSGKGYDAQGKFSCLGKNFDPLKIKDLISVGVLCNDASAVDSQYLGDPTEVALLVVGKKAGIYPDYERIAEKPFTSEDKFMSTVNKIEGKKVFYIKGAPEIILHKCKRIQTAAGIENIEAKHITEIEAISEKFSENALRVLGFAYEPDGDDENLIFLGLMGMIDPPRDGVAEAIALCKQAGIKVAMITGDHKLTALAIGKKIGITGQAITGEEIDRLSASKLAKIVDKTSIYARVTPEHKVKILEAYKKKNNIVAMTGDGVNDAPALKRADIGVAVNSSTDVAKEAADMILTDNHFRSIVSAVEEGRHIFINIRKFVRYLLSCNLGELMTVFFGVILGLGEPLLAVQILWMNLITDGLPALALTSEPLGKRAMKRPPRDPKEPILSRPVFSEILYIGVVMTIIALAVFYHFRADPVYARTMVFTCLVIMQLCHAFNNRTSGSVFRMNPFSNWKLIVAVTVSFALQLAVIYTPLNYLFKTAPILVGDFVLLIGVALIMIIFSEIWKASRAKFFNNEGRWRY